jgi:hypothetical protein
MDVSSHAYERAKDRLSWGKDTVDRMSERAWVTGVTPSDIKGRLKSYLDGKLNSYVGIEHLRIYGEYIYFYAHDCLVTIYRLPSDLIHLIPK